ncbi:hypothetical protein DFH06DRAFT_1319246 [Mycena polygramma]|nr:hypothetical protein DFH06DRAFT_1319246 [Mycena polygramma]
MPIPRGLVHDLVNSCPGSRLFLDGHLDLLARRLFVPLSLFLIASTSDAPDNHPSFPASIARLLSWFLDAPAAPFGVHRMALAGKAAGKDVGMWFGPSAAAGAF